MPIEASRSSCLQAAFPNRHSATPPRPGSREYASSGNKSFNTGDKIKKPPAGGGGGGGKTGTDTGEGEDDFMFVLSREEFLDLFFEDMELPNLVKRGLKQIEVKKPPPCRVFHHRLTVQHQHRAYHAQFARTAHGAETTAGS